VRRREFITLLGGAATWPLAARAQQPATMPVIGFLSPRSADDTADQLRAFRKGLSETGYADGQNVTIEHHWLEGRYEQVPVVLAELVNRRVAVIVAGGNTISLAAKSATSTIPIVFGVGDDPVKLGLVSGLARPGGNVTGVNFFFQEVTAKRVALLHQLVPSAAHIVALFNPTNATATETTSREVQEAARAIGLQVTGPNASTSREIDAAFAVIERDRPDALFVAGDAFFTSRRVQIANLAARDRIPAAYGDSETALSRRVDELRRRCLR